MAGQGEGWFIDTHDGTVIPIVEHWTAVKEQPKRFRMTLPEIEGKNRDTGLRLVFKRGFIRVRDHVGQVTFQFHGNRRRALCCILPFCRSHYGASETLVLIEDFRSGSHVVCKARELQRLDLRHVTSRLESAVNGNRKGDAAQ